MGDWFHGCLKSQADCNSGLSCSALKKEGGATGRLYLPVFCPMYGSLFPKEGSCLNCVP